jgi:hypothetical protein
MAFCPSCGSELQYKEAEICPKCGVRIKSPPQAVKTLQGRRPFRLGLIGGTLGILTGLCVMALGSFNEIVMGYTDMELIGLGFVAIIFSIVGIVGAVLGNHKIGGIMMVIAGVVVLIATSFFGVLTSILFVIGGILQFRRTDI